MFRLYLIIVLCFACVTLESHAILHVPDQFGNIQEAIDAAVDRDTILVAPGRYVENIEFHGRSVLLVSHILFDGDEGYIDSTIIDGNGEDCTLCFVDAEDSLCIVRGFTITGGYQNFGGGIDIQDSANPVLEDLLVTGNEAVQIGGGIYCTWYSRPTIRRVTVTGNTADEGAGFGFAHECHPLLENVTITDNTANLYGGGIFAGHGDGEFTLIDSDVSGNTAGYGGGVYIYHSANCSLSNVAVTGNTARTAGGGMYFDSTSPSVTECLVSDNTADSAEAGGLACVFSSSPVVQFTEVSNNTAPRGGAIHCDGESSPRFFRCLIHDNRADEDVAALLCTENSAPHFINVTMARNVTVDFGALAFLSNGSTLILVNSILWGNSTSSVVFDMVENPGLAVVAYSDVAGGEGSLVDNDNADVFWLDSNVTADPLFLAPEEGDFRLSDESPCVETGVSFFEWNGDTLIDFDEDDYIGRAPDMGALESDFIDSVPDSRTPAPYSWMVQAPHPNPFNAMTGIRFHLPVASTVTVIILDDLGRTVQPGIEQYYPSGDHRFNWSPRNLPSGVYNMQVIIGRRNYIRRAVLLK